MLPGERDVWIAPYHETLEKRFIKVVAVAYLNCQSVIVDFQPELLMVANQDKVFCAGGKGCLSRISPASSTRTIPGLAFKSSFAYLVAAVVVQPIIRFCPIMSAYFWSLALHSCS